MGSSGGGGSSGKVDFPDYMKTWHANFLGNGVTGGIDLTMAMDAALTGASPYAGFIPISVSDVTVGSGVSITSFSSPFTYLQNYAGMDFDTLVAAYRTNVTENKVAGYLAGINSKIDSLINAEAAMLNNDLQLNVLPLYSGNMRNINAVMSSAFGIGEAILLNAKEKDLAKMDAVLRLEAFKADSELRLKNEELCFKYATQRILSKRDIATTAMDFAKLYIGLKMEVDDSAVEMAAKDRLWDLKIFQYGGNFLGSIAGSAVATDTGKGSKAASAVGGAVGGAAMGASVTGGNPYGIAIGAVVGAIYGLMS